MAGDQHRSVVVWWVEVASVDISGKEGAEQAKQWEAAAQATHAPSVQSFHETYHTLQVESVL